MSDSTLERVKRAALAMQRYSWEQGVIAQAFLESGDMDTAILMAVEAANRQISDGRCASIGGQDAATDPCAIGEVLVTACEQTADSALIDANDRMMQWALADAPRNAEGIVYHMCSTQEFWVDSFYMLPPYLARMGFWDEALLQIDGFWHTLYHPEKGLLSHRWDDQKREFIREDFWGVGNGWAAAGMTRVIHLLPFRAMSSDLAERRTELTQRVDTLIRSALQYQRQDGLFHDVLDDPDSFREVNCGQMFAYCIYRGVADGWLQDDLIEPAERIWHAVQQEVDQYGLVRNVCGVPDFIAPHVAPEGQAFYILMDAARRDWLAGQS